MATVNSPLTKIDQDAERRRALAKVYSLLLRLADETPNTSTANPATSQTPEEETTVLAGKEEDVTF